jgi:hypothetical protein
MTHYILKNEENNECATFSFLSHCALIPYFLGPLLDTVEGSNILGLKPNQLTLDWKVNWMAYTLTFNIL